MDMSTDKDTAHDGETEVDTSPENLKVQGEALAAKVKELLHEGSVRRITVKDTEGHTVIEIPVTAGVVAAVVAPALVAVAALAAVASEWEISVHRSG
jgi:hypothetical protein